MHNLTNQEKENIQFQRLSGYILLLFFLAFTIAGLIRIFLTGDSFSINQTKLLFQLKSVLQYLLFGILFFVGWVFHKRYYKTNKLRGYN